jgi:hypothetical protein
MSVSVSLEFVPPDQPEIVALRIFEATSSDGPFAQIERTTEIGTYPAYISRYTTANANSADDWFAIQWEDDKGALSVMSAPVRGGVPNLVQVVTDRVFQRDPALDKAVVLWEAEGVIEQFYGEGVDPYTAEVPGYRKLNGLVYLTMARCYAFESAVESESVTIGLVRLQQSGTAQKNIDGLIELANQALGWNTSVVLQMRDIRQRHHRQHEVLCP